MGVLQEVGSEVTNIKPGDRVVIPFNISCGHCYMCDKGLMSQCETTQVHEYGTGAAFLGYTKLYGQVPGGQAEFLRVPQAQFGPIKVPEGPPDDRFVYLSDVLPTAWQAVEHADIPDGGSVLVPERLDRARSHDVDAIDLEATDEIAELVREKTGGRGPDSLVPILLEP
jgi:threonine dehydrogenase-like Zn-dependent dehydrogenase